MFDARAIKMLSDFKKFGILQPFNFFFIILISSIAGVPPLLGFVIKFISFLLLIGSNSFFYIMLLALFNFFTLYFYIQNIRYLISNSKNNNFIYKNNFIFLSETAVFLLINMLLLNIFGFFYISDTASFFQLFLI
jgi:NADH:ubiquinone oxidoreductase subunit 2 (subunit N)